MTIHSVLRRSATRAAITGLAVALVGVCALVSAASAAPVNDNFANAIPIPHGATVAGTNVAATGEAGERNHAGVSAHPISGLESVWWKFTALASGPVTVDTCGSSYDTTLGVYTGQAVNALSTVASNDDSCGLRSAVTFFANEGQTYYIAVDGYSDADSDEEGNIVLRVSPPLVCNARAGLGSFNGDGRRDLLFRRGDGMLSLYLMDGFNVVAAQLLGQVGTEWRLEGVGDFNGDGRGDLLFRRVSDGMLSVFLMDGFNVLAAQLIGIVGLEWRFIGTGDFNGDGKSDLLFKRDSDGEVSMYLMNGFNVLAAQIFVTFIGLTELVGIGDFNGDGKSDLVLLNPLSGSGFSVVTMNGFAFQGPFPLGAVGPEWTFAGVGDFNGDGRSDLLLRRDDGLLSIYRIGGNPPMVQVAAGIGVVGTEWTLVGVGDFNGDGRADLLFRRTDGMLSLYLMNGFNVLAAQLLGNVGTEWSNCLPNP